MDWTLDEYLEQLYRLRHAKQGADFYLDTNPLTAELVLQKTLVFINSIEKSSMD